MKKPFISPNSLKTVAGAIACCTVFSGCSRAEGRALSDFLQYLLNQDTWFRLIVCILLVFIALQAFRIVALVLRYTFRFIRESHRFIFIWGRRNLFVIAMLGTVLWLFSDSVVDFLQDIEQRYLNPVYIDEYNNLNEEHLIAIYEEELGKHVDPYQKKIIVQRSREMAAKIGASPLPIYEAAWLECGLNPFTVRTDQVAAGWIQFTRVGLGGLRYKGKPVTFDEVLQACQSKDIQFMMDLSELYLTDKYERAGRKPLNNTIDLYLALFAPALIGAEYSKIVYQGEDNPSYYKNDGLDGWYVTTTPDGKKQIFRKRSARDGKITIWEIFLALEAKKNALVRKYVHD
jgi:hypothetical protein